MYRLIQTSVLQVLLVPAKILAVTRQMAQVTNTNPGIHNYDIIYVTTMSAIFYKVADISLKSVFMIKKHQLLFTAIFFILLGFSIIATSSSFKNNTEKSAELLGNKNAECSK